MNTNTNISIFNHENFGEIRVVDREGEPWFVAKDACTPLALENVTEALRGLDEDEKAEISIPEVSFNGVTQKRIRIIISESGLYNLVFRSRKPEAKAFKRWVTHEVLPQIRKTGGYIPVKPGETDLEIMCRAFQILHATVESQKTQLAADAPKVEFQDQFLHEGANISIGALAKKLAQEGLPFGQNRLFEYLRRQNVLCRSRGINRNMPIQKYVDRGWFKVIAPPRSMADRWKATAYVTPKGVKEISARIHELFEKAHFN